MQCDTHPKFKGLKFPKNECSTCVALYNLVQEKSKSLKKYRSLTTENFDCGLFHLLTEISTMMIFGRLPEFFWRKNSNSSGQVKEHYQKIYSSLMFWQKNNPDLFKNIDLVFWKIYGEYNKQNIANQIKNQENNKVSIEKIEINKDAVNQFLGEHDG